MALSKRNRGGSYDFSTSQNFSDLVLVVENVQFHVHKCVLSMCSPKFKKMLLDFPEKDAKTMELPGKPRKDEFESFLKVIYSDIISGQEQQINDTNYKFLLQLAHEYQVRRVKHLCFEFIASKTVTESNCFEILKVADEYSLEDVMEKCAEEASRKPCSVLETSAEFRELKPETREKVYAKRAKYIERSVETNYFTPIRRQEDQVSSSPVRESLR